VESCRDTFSVFHCIACRGSVSGDVGIEKIDTIATTYSFGLSLRVAESPSLFSIALRVEEAPAVAWVSRR
jgi:hypothetical protein